MCTYNFGGSGRYLTKLRGDMARSQGDNVDTNFARGAPTKFGMAKTSKIQRNFR